jgi:hypothetical protein
MYNAADLTLKEKTPHEFQVPINAPAAGLLAACFNLSAVQLHLLHKKFKVNRFMFPTKNKKGGLFIRPELVT